MTGEQHRLYTGMLRLFATFGTGGAAWTGLRASGGTPAATWTINLLSVTTIRFCQNNRIRQADTLPALPIFTAAWWGLASTDADIQAGDVYANGTFAFVVTGTPDTSQGFLVVPAASTQLPANHAGAAAGGYQAGLRIGAW